jgi:hypothetical protein
MPDSFGKRQRDQVKARKAAARDDRRVARNKRRKGLDTTEPRHDVAWGLPGLDQLDDASTPAETEDREAPASGTPVEG